MTRTALELTATEWQAYRPGRGAYEKGTAYTAQLERRRQQAWRIARKAAALLRREYGASKIAVFGSLVHEAAFTPWSDVDLAAWGIPPERFYGAVATVSGLSASFKVDLVDPDTCRPSMLASLERDGVFL